MHTTGSPRRHPNSAHKEFIYFNDDGDLANGRYENWKMVFEEQRAPGTMRIWAEPSRSCASQGIRPAVGPP